MESRGRKLRDLIGAPEILICPGADVVFADALMSEDDIATVAAQVPKPLSVNMGLASCSGAPRPRFTQRGCKQWECPW